MGPMTALLAPPNRARRSRARRAPAHAVAVAAACGAARAAALGLLSVTVAVLVGWATAADTGASASEAVAASLQTWLVAHHTQLTVPGGAFGLAPLGLTAFLGWLLLVEAQRAARARDLADNRGVAVLTCALASTYGLIATVLALVARTDAVEPLPVSALLGAAAVAGVAGGAGALRGAGTWPMLWRRVPFPAQSVTTAAAGAAAVLLGGGGFVMALALAAHFGRFVDLVRSLDAGATGMVLIALLSLAYVPTAVVWSTSFVVGPGFAIGAGTSIGVAGADLGATPAFPLLAALPADGGTTPLGVAVLLVPAAAGVTAGLLLDRADRRRTKSALTSWRHVLTMSWSSAAAAGAALVVCAVSAGGPGGPGRLAEVGPSGWLLGVVTALWVGLLSTVTLAVRRRTTLLAPPEQLLGALFRRRRSAP